MDELSNELSKNNIGCSIGTKLINHVIYADDIVVFSPSLKGLQVLMDICNNYMTTNFLKLNTKKTKCIKFEKKKVQPRCSQDLYIGGQNIEFVDRIKYLGFILTSNNKDDDHIEHLYRGLCGRTNMLLRIFGKCDLETKTVLFRSFCTSLYCISLISNCKVSTLYRLRVCHNTGLRMTVGAPRQASASQLFVQHNLPSLPVLRRLAVVSLLCRLRVSSNPILQNIMHRYHSFNSDLFNTWRTISYCQVQQ